MLSCWRVFFVLVLALPVFISVFFCFRGQRKWLWTIIHAQRQDP